MVISQMPQETGAVAIRIMLVAFALEMARRTASEPPAGRANASASIAERDRSSIGASAFTSGRDPELDLRVDVDRQRVVPADQEVRDDELVEREREGEERAGDDRRAGSAGSTIRPSRWNAFAPRSLGGALERAVEPLQAADDEQHHERRRVDRTGRSRPSAARAGVERDA